MPGIGLVLDVVIVVLLGATIFYAIRLSRNLETFRSNRSEMEHLIRELSTQITRAQAGVTALDDAAKESGDELRTIVAKAQGLIEELALMTEAGDNMASRLENLATRNRSMVDELGNTAASLVYPGAKPAPTPYTPEKYTPDKKSEPAYRDPPLTNSTFFAIRDPDFDRPEKSGVLGSAVADERDISSALPETEDDHTSQAERDLASALRRRRPRNEA